MTSESPYDLGPSSAFAAELIAEMTLAEKVGQITQIEKNSITPQEVADHGIGSVLSGGGGNPTPNDAENWAEMVGSYVDASRRSRLGIPALYGTDAVHGHSNVVGATIFPHNIGLGAAGDPELVERVNRAAALETTATGARWMFAPALSVALDPRWGRTYESFSDDPELVSILGAAAVRGMIGDTADGADTALACAKHYVGDGGTSWGSARPSDWLDFWKEWGDDWKLDQGDTRVDEMTLRATHLRPFLSSIAAGALTVMASYSSWNGTKLHAHRYLLTDVLKGELGFGGFVISDWLGLDQLHPDPYQRVVIGINAGVDMVMVPFDHQQFISTVMAAVQAGDITMGRLDEAVGRILAVKHAIGLFADEPQPPPSLDVVGSAAHRSLAREAVVASAVLLKNESALVPLQPGPVLLAGSGADDIGNQCGGWTIEWQGSPGPITPGSTILDGFRSAGAQSVGFDVTSWSGDAGLEDARWPVGVVVVAEPPYAEGNGDNIECTLPTEDIEAVRAVRSRVDRLVVVVLSGRPVVLDPIIDHADAIVAAWLPGSEGAGVVDVLTGAQPFVGRLPRPWFETWPRGHGLA